MNNRAATVALCALLATAGTVAPAHADPDVNLQGSEASPCLPITRELRDAQARVVELDSKVTVLSVRLRQARSTIERKQSTIDRLRDQLAAARR